MLLTLVVAASVVTQVLGVVLALRLVRLTGRRLPWLLIAAALLLMALRRCAALWALCAGLHAPAFHLGNEVSGLVISVLALFGVASIGPLLRDMDRARKAQEQSESKYRALLEQASDAIFVVDQDGHLLEVNAKATDLLGYSRSEMLGLNLRDLIPPDISNAHPLGTDVLGRASPACHQCAVRTKNGVQPIVEVSSSKLADGRILAIARDVSERRRAEDELLRAQKLESVGVLAGGIAHDFNNILTAIIGNVNLARLVIPADAAAQPRLMDAERAIARARDLTRQLLTFAKGGSPVKKAASIAELLEESATFTLRGSNVRCEFLLAPDVWPIDADEGQMSQVISNLIINASQAMPDGGTITIRADNVCASTLDPSARASDFVLMSITDEGSGISPELLDRIFDPYFTTKPEGTGLGLAVCYSIVKKHGGRIVVDSKVGKGSTFQVYLPAAQRPAVVATEQDAETPTGHGRILVMDDEEMVRSVAVQMLAHLGYDVDLCVDGQEAVALYEARLRTGAPYDVVIADLTIPGGMGGKDTVKRIRDMDPSAIVIATSGYSRDPIMADHAAYGFAAVIEKPYRLEDLSQVLRAVMRRSRVPKSEVVRGGRGQTGAQWV